MYPVGIEQFRAKPAPDAVSSNLLISELLRITIPLLRVVFAAENRYSEGNCVVRDQDDETTRGEEEGQREPSLPGGCRPCSASY